MSRLVLLLAMASPALGQLPPQQALDSLKVADGLQVELFAAEPMLLNPTSIDIDHLGRVWVCEAVNYRRLPPYNRPILREAGDRIVILTDKDGDGKADDSTVFHQGKDLYGPLGIAIAPIANGKAPGSCKVFVCQSPDILLFEDLDGDGKADGPPKKFLTNFGGFDHDHGVHGINIGPDGKLYFTVGDSGVKGLQSSDGKGRKWVSNDTDVQKGTVWRCDMDGKNLELIAHNFRNNYECCVNSFGEIWLSDNDDDGNQQTRICHVMPGGNYGYGPRGPGQSHWHEEQPGIVHKTLRTGFGSPTGICFYEGTLLPKKYHGQLLHTDAGPRELRAFHIKPKGAGYELDKENLVTTNDSWFRPSDVCVAPDGSVFIADWYDPGVGGHGMGDWTRGRIYRVSPKGHKGYKVPKVDVKSPEGVQQLLGSPCLATRALAVAVIGVMTPDEATLMIGADRIAGQLEKGAKGSQELLARITWMFARRGLSLVDNTDRINFLAMTDLMDRRAVEIYLRAAPAFHTMHGQLPVLRTDASLRGVLEVMADKANSPDQADNPQMSERREMLLLLPLLPSEQCQTTFFKLARFYDGQDRFYLSALNIACGTDPRRRDIILADFDKHFPEWNDKVADLVWELRPKSVLPRLGRLLTDGKLTPAQRGRVVDILAASDDPEAGKTMLDVLKSDAPEAVKSRAFANLLLHLPTKWNAIAKSPGFQDPVLAGLKNKETRGGSMQLIAAARIEAAIGGLEAFAADATGSLDERKQAVRTLGELKSDNTIAGLEKLSKIEELRKDAIQALGMIRTGASITPLKRIVLDGKLPLDIRHEAVTALSASFDGTRWLVMEKEAGVLPTEVHALAGRLTRNSPFQAMRNKALLVFPPPGKLDVKKLPSIAVLAKRTGDANRGRQVMAASLKGEAQCLKCHTVNGSGGQIGPDLSMIGKKASRENLIESILLPSKAIADQFLMHQVETKKGQQLQGLLVQQGAAGITLRDANGKDTVIAQSDIESLAKSPKSIMPEDIIAAFTEDELIDVVEYMLTLKTASLTPDAWQIVGPFPVTSMAEGVDKAFEVEKHAYNARDTFTESGQRKAINAGFLGKLTWKTTRPGATGYIDLAGLHGAAANNSVSYAYREIESPADQDATVLLGIDDGGKLFVNGKEVFVGKDTQAASPEQHRIAIKLTKGTNKLLLKIANGGNPHGFYLTLLAEHELKSAK